MNADERTLNDHRSMMLANTDTVCCGECNQASTHQVCVWPSLSTELNLYLQPGSEAVKYNFWSEEYWGSACTQGRQNHSWRVLQPKRKTLINADSERETK